jgi:hypothetical protein
LAGFSKLYVIGGLGGFQGADGVNPILMQIWVGDGGRQWLEPHYFDRSIKQLGSIKTLIPERPDDPRSLLDACIAFFPKHFEQCPSLAEVALLLEDATHLDFDLDKPSIPVIWRKLREEARPYFNLLHIFEAVLRPVVIQEESSK